MKQILYYILVIILFSACKHSRPQATMTEEIPDIFPDYSGVTIPYNIAPLNFSCLTKHTDARLILSCGNEDLIVTEKKGYFDIPVKSWKKLLEKSRGKTIQAQIYLKEQEWKAYQPIEWHVADEPTDPYIAYRLIEPGYELWNRMGIYQRNLETFTQTAIMENKMTDNNCMNCHSFCMQDPDQMLFHMRETHPATMIIRDGKIEKLNTKTDQTVSFLVYPSWHPSGKYVAFSVNNTRQSFHLNDRNRIEVYDDASDVVVYDIEKHEIITTDLIFQKEIFETFPTFSPDGKTLYFCSAEAKNMPVEFEDVKYSLCSITFDPDTRSFGQTVDTLYNAIEEGGSISFPRVSPDGKYLMYTKAGYGNFSIWHKDADLYMVDLKTRVHVPLQLLNSDDVESYHSWSSNSRWIIFSSRRIDGLYTRPYIAYIDENGNPHKPFLLPQKDPNFYDRFMKSYNIPEFIKSKVRNRAREISLIAKKEKGNSVTFAK